MILLNIYNILSRSIACDRDGSDDGNNDGNGDGHGNNNNNNNENGSVDNQHEIANIKRKLDALEDHNRSLISDKKELEDLLSSEKTKFARTEDKLANLERDLANREKQWKIKEKELRDTITELRANLGKKAEPSTSCQSEAASSFAKVVSNEGT